MIFYLTASNLIEGGSIFHPRHLIAQPRQKMIPSHAAKDRHKSPPLGPTTISALTSRSDRKGNLSYNVPLPLSAGQQFEYIWDALQGKRPPSSNPSRGPLLLTTVVGRRYLPVQIFLCPRTAGRKKNASQGKKTSYISRNGSQRLPRQQQQITLLIVAANKANKTSFRGRWRCTVNFQQIRVLQPHFS